MYAQCSCQGAGGGQRCAPAVIGVFYYGIVITVNQTDNVVLPETFKGLGLSQQSAFCPQKALLAGIIHLNFCNNIFAEKHIVGSSELAIIFSNVRMDCSTKTSEFKQKEAALTFTLSSS